MNTSCLVLALWASISVSYAQFTEDFSSGSLTQPRLWQGTSSYFRINADQQLQSDGPPASSTLFLQTTSNTLRHTLWQCWLKMDFPSSTTNFAKMILAASSNDFLDPGLEAYYVKVGGLSGAADGIDLYYQKGSTHTRLIKGIEGRAGADVVELRLKVTCDVQGNWTLYSDTSGMHQFQLEGRSQHRADFEPQAFGLVCIHSSTRRDKFYVDDIIIDSDPFFLTGIEAIDKHTLTLQFSTHFLMNWSKEDVLLDGKPLQPEDHVELFDHGMRIHLKTPLIQGHHTLYMPPIQSLAGKDLGNSGSFDFSFIRMAQASDLLITEIMADPDPVIGLPSAEYVELYNASLDTLWLGSCRFGDPSTQAVFPAYRLAPRQRLLVTSVTNVPLLQTFGNVLGLSPWPSLNNDRDSLFLFNSLGLKIDEVVYNISVLNDSKKRVGGWSLEMIHEKEHCRGFLNWSYSEDLQGGTPGRVNSLTYYPFDRSAPRFIGSLFNAAEKRCELFVDEPLDTTALPSIRRLDNEKRMTPLFKNDRQVTFPLVLLEGNAVVLEIRGLKDCSGNTKVLDVEINHPKSVGLGDVKINEVLFNPFPYGSDFVELYNDTDIFIKLDGVVLKNKDEKEVQLPSCTMSPRSYKILTSDSMAVKEFYPHTAWGTCVKTALPPLPDALGLIALYSSAGELLDCMQYTEDQHHPFLARKEGFSLERVNLDESSFSASNWLSASMVTGGATPGYRNSQSFDSSVEGTFWIEPRTISPGTDGYRNYAHIHYQTPQPGTSVRVDVYSLDGHWICALQVAGPSDVQGSCIWDGTDDYKQPVGTGLYVVILDFLQSDGTHYKRKGTIGVLSP